MGAEVARRGKGLGMKVIAYDPYASDDKARALGVNLVSFDEALEQGDFFSLHMPLTKGTAKMFSDEAFSKIKKGASIINVARGGVIDEEALHRALENGKYYANHLFTPKLQSIRVGRVRIGPDCDIVLCSVAARERSSFISLML